MLGPEDFINKDDYINHLHMEIQTLSEGYNRLSQEFDTMRQYNNYITDAMNNLINENINRFDQIVEFVECSNKYKLTYDKFTKDKDIVVLDARIDGLLH